MDASTLYEAIAEVCPVTNTSVGKADDRATWKYVAGAGATAQQIADADNVVATIPINPTLTVVDWIGRFSNAEYRAATAAAWRGTAGNAKNWDVVAFDNPIKLSRKKTITLRDALIADGILTAQRAAEIFS